MPKATLTVEERASATMTAADPQLRRLPLHEQVLAELTRPPVTEWRSAHQLLCRNCRRTFEAHDEETRKCLFGPNRWRAF